MRKPLILFCKIFIILFAILGLCNIGLFVATKLKWTNEMGIIDKNDRYFQNISTSQRPLIPVKDSLLSVYQNNLSEGLILQKLLKLKQSYPKNAHLIFEVYQQTKDLELADRMLDAISVCSLNNLNDSVGRVASNPINKNSRYIQNWMNSEEWEILKETLIKEKSNINKASIATGIESRIILCCVIGEQLRIYNQARERFKQYFAPAKKLSFMTNLSYGVTGIKEGAAILTENHNKDRSSPFYLGTEYEHLLNFSTEDPTQERLDRLKNYSDHFYSYLYTALILKQTKVQWEKAGFDISNRPEILATLYNIGFWKSKPKEIPKAGGACFIINNDSCTFGGVAFDFYYSGELFNEFPYLKDKWPDSFFK